MPFAAQRFARGRPQAAQMMLHALSVDVEDWFQVLNMAHKIDRADWDKLQLRCADSTRRLLDLFARRECRATFFFLGWIAERMPEVVLEVAKAGHEIGSHGYDHRLLPDLGREGLLLIWRAPRKCCARSPESRCRRFAHALGR